MPSSGPVPSSRHGSGRSARARGRPWSRPSARRSPPSPPRMPGAGSGSPATHPPNDPQSALAAGTFIFDDLAGPRALAAFHAVAGDRPQDLLPRTLGQFTLVLRRGDRAWLLHDQVGFHQLFRSPDDAVLSTSFLLAARLLDRVSVDPQGLLEYVFSGVPLGDATPLAELRLLGKDSFLELDVAGCCERYTPPDLPDETWPADLDAEEATRTCLAALRQVGERSLRALRQNVACALSGGYDSRLVLALLREQGVAPHLFVYGPNDSPDVTCARAIATGEGLTLDHIDKSTLASVDAKNRPATVAANFLAQDGYGQEDIFDNGGERLARERRVSAAPVQFHGGGGETLRDFFYLPDRPFSARELALTFWGQFDPATLTAVLPAADYLAGVATKLTSTLGTGRLRLPRPWVEWLYPHFRCRSWVGREASNNHRYAPIFTPFLEPPALAASLSVPLRLKMLGRLEARLIRSIDPRLASYPSAYGHPLNGRVTLAHRASEALARRRPPYLRHASFRLKTARLRSPSLPVTLLDPAVDQLLPERPSLLCRYIHVGRLYDPAQRHRSSAAEYLLRYLNVVRGLRRGDRRGGCPSE